MELTIELDAYDDQIELENVRTYKHEGDNLLVDFHCKNPAPMTIYDADVIGTPNYRDASDVLAELDFVETWENYGDMNPKQYGGVYGKWTGDQWKVVETWTSVENEFEIRIDWVEPMDIWVNGNPERGFTEKFQEELDSYPVSHKPTTQYDMETLTGLIINFSTKFSGNPRNDYADLDDYETELSDRFDINLKNMDNVILE